ncbi:MAG: OmpA family protein [Micrococcales bacterium]|nr:OmpA family protein [Micrococcales bacterium]
MRATALAALGLTLAIAGCSGGDEEASGTASPGTGATVATSATSDSSVTSAPSAGPGAATGGSAAVEPAVEQAQATIARLCAPGPGKQVERLEAPELPGVSGQAVTVPDARLGGEVLKGFTVPAPSVSPQQPDAGCVVRYAAPAGCLGAVEISPAYLPPVTLEGYELPETRAGAAVRPGKRVPAQTSPGVVREGSRVEQQCQAKPAKEGQYVGSVYRGSLYRGSLYRGALYREGASVQSVCLDGECSDASLIPAVSLPAASLGATAVGAEALSAYVVQGAPDLEGYRSDTEQVFVAPADVFFDTDRSTLKPAALAALKIVSKELAATTGPVRVEGHTDDTGTTAHNLTLSKQRAEAVAAWLKGEGGIEASRIATKGHGESVPAGPNASAADRAKNRRVVISAGR